MADVASDVTIGMLGPLEVVGPRLCTLVIGLALDPDRVVLASQLIDAVVDGTAGGGDQRAWLTDTWAKVGVDPQATARAVIGGWGARRPAGPPAWRADRRGGPGAGAAGHELCA